MLNDQWVMENEKEKLLEAQQKLINKQRNMELIKHNELEKE